MIFCRRNCFVCSQSADRTYLARARNPLGVGIKQFSTAAALCVFIEFNLVLVDTCACGSSAPVPSLSADRSARPAWTFFAQSNPDLHCSMPYDNGLCGLRDTPNEQ